MDKATAKMAFAFCLSKFTGKDCSALRCSDHGRDVEGKCQCDTGFGGVDCEKAACVKDCSGRGDCVHGICKCSAGYAGEGCEVLSCSFHGKDVDGKCVCEPEWTGVDCETVNCNGRGSVDTKTKLCSCDAAWTGANCQDRKCSALTGKLVGDDCICNAGYGGVDCAFKLCKEDCNGRGKCVEGVCQCNQSPYPGFTGD